MAFPPNFTPRPPSMEPNDAGAPEPMENEAAAPAPTLTPEECAKLSDALTPEVMDILQKLAANSDEAEPDADDQGEAPAALVVAAPAPSPSFARPKTGLNRV